MFCPNCGAEAQEGALFCTNCGAKLGDFSKSSEAQPETVKLNHAVSDKSKIVAGLLGIFLGCFGVHNFYLGYTGKAVAQLLLSLLSVGILSGISAIWGLIEGILILCGGIDADSEGKKLAN